MEQHEIIIAQIKKWITDVVVGCNFCPFAAKEIKRDSVFYEVVNGADSKVILEKLSSVFTKMDDDDNLETALLIIPEGFQFFTSYLNLVETAEKFLEKENYEGVYQIASFHPQYLFAGSNEDDPANYTNRSPYPMLHILREESLSKVIDNFPNVDDIPEKNIKHAQAKGLAQMKLLLFNCLEEN
jgi:uncharacterized protein